MATRRHPYPPRTREEGYFHSGNSGLTLRLIERQVDTREESPSPVKGSHELPEPDRIIRSEYDYRFEARHGAHGAHSAFNIPLTPEMCLYLSGALLRLHGRMTRLDGPSAYRDAEHSHHLNHVLASTPFEKRGTRTVTVINGCNREPAYAPTIVTSPYSTARLLLGYEHRNPITGEVEFFERVDEDSDEGSGSGSSGGLPQYWPNELGMTVKAVQDSKRGRPDDRFDTDVTPLSLFVNSEGHVCAYHDGELQTYWTGGAVAHEDDVWSVNLPARRHMVSRPKGPAKFRTDPKGNLHISVPGNLDLVVDKGSKATLADGAVVNRAARRTEDESEGDVGC